MKREWKALTSFGFGLAVLLAALWVGMGPPGTGTRGALGTVPLSFTPALVLLGIASWGLVIIWRAAGSRQG